MEHHYWRPGHARRVRGSYGGEATDPPIRQTKNSSHLFVPSSTLDDDSGVTGDSITVNYNPLKHLPIHQQRERLAITAHRRIFLWALETSRVVIVVGDAGCGKSTQLPQYVVEGGWICENEVVFVVVSRRIAAVSLAGRTAEERGCSVGGQVGFITSEQSAVSSSSRIIYLTDGVLLRLVQNDPLLLRSRVVILDDCHDRRLNCDLLMSIFKRISKFRPDLRLVLCSATIHVQTFIDFFSTRWHSGSGFQNSEKIRCIGDPLHQNGSSNSNAAFLRHEDQDCLKDISVVEILSENSRKFPVNILYLKEPCRDYLDAAMQTVLDIHTNCDVSEGNILVFLVGRDEIDDLAELLETAVEPKRFRHSLEIAQLYGALPNELQLRALRPARRGARKVILSTNVAESSITIDNIGFVVDVGFQRLNITDQESGVEFLCELPISRASAKQRAGRVGRTQKGMCFRLYTEDTFFSENRPLQFPDATGLEATTPGTQPRVFPGSMPDFETPEVTRCSLTSAILYLLSLGVENFVFDFELPSPVPSEYVAAALTELHALEAIDDLGRLTKPMGLRMAMLPLSPIISRFVLLSSREDFSCSYEAIIIASMLHAGSPWIVPHARTAAKLDILTAAQQDIGVKEGDLVTLYNVYKQAEHYKDDDPGWVERHQISRRQLRRAEKMKNQVEKAFNDWNIPISSTGCAATNLRRAICAGFFYNAAQRQTDGSYRLLRSETHQDQLQRLGRFYLEPQSLCSSSTPLYIVFASAFSASSSSTAVVQATNRGEKFCILLSGITPIDPPWLEELVGHFFQLTWHQQLQAKTPGGES